jgi:toxin FitB
MIILDTNVLAELMKQVPDGKVLTWVTAQSAGDLYTTSVAEAEILHGVLSLPSGRRRKALEAAVAGIFEEVFSGRILPFGSEAALAYAQIAVERRKAGRPISAFDAQIAAIARSVGAALATRNTTDFERCGIKIINPWL